MDLLLESQHKTSAAHVSVFTAVNINKGILNPWKQAEKTPPELKT